MTSRPIHRPVYTKHGTHCLCGVFCGSRRDSWIDHARDRQLLDGYDRVVADYHETPETVIESFQRAMRGFAEMGAEANRKLTQAVGQFLDAVAKTKTTRSRLVLSDTEITEL